MRYTSLLIIAIILTCFFLSCSENQTTTPEEKNINLPVVFGKMLGRWNNTGNNSIEQWTQTGDSSFTAIVFSINGTDTIRTEEAIIYPEYGKWIFENKVSGQNDGKAIRFVATVLSDTAMQFSNPAHDFPTDIYYSVTGPAGMRAFITGPGKTGRKDTVNFVYSRIKD